MFNQETNITAGPQTVPAETPAEAVNVIGISFRDSAKVYYFDANGTEGRTGAHAIVETTRGQEYARISMANRMIPKSELVLPLKKVVRIATEADEQHMLDNEKREEEAFRICRKLIEKSGLDMKLIEAEYTFDNSKLLFYFTSADRVDFRELVKELAQTFHTRIELRQIGIRDETKIIGGLGVCGREYCCHGFLSDFTQVSIKMAKVQGLSLNSAKISGACGRLMCCLKYEHESYLEEIERTPKAGEQLVTPDGTGVVTEVRPLTGTVKVRLDADPDAVPKAYSRDEVRARTADDPVTATTARREAPPAARERTEISRTPVNVAFTPSVTQEERDSVEAVQPRQGDRGRNGRRRRPQGKKREGGKDAGTAQPNRGGDQKKADQNQAGRKKPFIDKPAGQQEGGASAKSGAQQPQGQGSGERTGGNRRRNNRYRRPKKNSRGGESGGGAGAGE